MEKYSIVRMAGRGAYGTVYLARRNTDGREVKANSFPTSRIALSVALLRFYSI